MELVKDPMTRSITKWLFAHLFFYLALASCTNPGGQPANQPGKSGERREALTKPPSGFSDTVEIHGPAAVFFNPGSKQLLKIKAVTDSSIFKSMQHDCFFQQRNARIVMKKYYPHIPIIEPQNTRYLLYMPEKGQRECIDLDKRNDPCGIILFDGVKPSRFTDMTNIDTDLGFYFRR